MACTNEIIEEIESKLTNIANAIRKKIGVMRYMTMDEMVEEIGNIKTTVEYKTGTAEIILEPNGGTFFSERKHIIGITNISTVQGLDVTENENAFGFDISINLKYYSTSNLSMINANLNCNHGIVNVNYPLTIIIEYVYV